MCDVGLTANDQLTDRGPPLTLELPRGVAEPPFGAATFSAASRLFD